MAKSGFTSISSQHFSIRESEVTCHLKAIFIVEEYAARTFETT